MKMHAGYDERNNYADIFKWTIAHWSNHNYSKTFEWMRTGWDVEMEDSDFVEINENRIPAPDETVYTTLRYDLIGANVHSINAHPQTFMSALGYTVVNYASGEIGDCVFIKIKGAFELTPTFITRSDYVFTTPDW